MIEDDYKERHKWVVLIPLKFWIKGALLVNAGLKKVRCIMKKLTLFVLCLAIIFCAVSSRAADVTLAWDANSEPDLAGYRIFMHVEGDAYDYGTPDWQGTATTCTLMAPLQDTIYYFVARAFDDSGNESGDSNEVSYHTPDLTPPAIPKNLRFVE